VTSGISTSAGEPGRVSALTSGIDGLVGLDPTGGAGALLRLRGHQAPEGCGWRAHQPGGQPASMVRQPPVGLSSSCELLSGERRGRESPRISRTAPGCHIQRRGIRDSLDAGVGPTATRVRQGAAATAAAQLSGRRMTLRDGWAAQPEVALLAPSDETGRPGALSRHRSPAFRPTAVGQPRRSATSSAARWRGRLPTPRCPPAPEIRSGACGPTSEGTLLRPRDGSRIAKLNRLGNVAMKSAR
jgi:hypothetical protein